jgi:glutamate/tyrosine decarboxylase-like PLP-dependent enzyme
MRDLLDHTKELALEYLRSLPTRRVAPSASSEEMLTSFDGPLPESPSDPKEVIDDMARRAEPGLMAKSGPRFFGFVIGGSVPAATAADWLTTAWDQNSGLAGVTPAAVAMEAVAARWLKQLLNLPSDASHAFVTGGQMANFTCLVAARHHVLSKAGWDVESDGLIGAPEVRVFVGEERHVTIDSALRLAGFGAGRTVRIPSDDQGNMLAEPLARALAEWNGPAIVCAQAGNVNTGGFDPFAEICDAAGAQGAWVHIDGAFGLWAAVSDRLRHLTVGMERADSWATDAHKWLNVPYDCGLAFTAHPESHRASTGPAAAAYLVHAEDGVSDPLDWTPEFSRRGRGLTVYAAIKSLGRSGISDMVERCCDHARLFAQLLKAGGAEILNEVVLNQVLVRFGDDARTRAVIDAVQADGTCWLGGSTWKGRGVMRISVINWSTTTDDVERSAAAILKAADSV